MRASWLWICATTVACSSMPTSPTAPTATDTAPRIQNMRWDVVAPGCAPSPVPAPTPDPDAANLEPAPQNHLRATWDWSERAGRPTMLIADFVEQDGLLKLCTWDTSDL